MSWATPYKTVSTPPKMGSPKKIGIVMIVKPRARTGPQGTSEIELAPVMPVRVSKKFCPLDVAASSHGLHAGLTMTHVERTSRVPTFDNLSDDSSPDVRKTPSPRRVHEKCASPP
jgi:hypothetical protein